MHRSRLYGMFIDTPLAEAPAAIEFWGRALGVTPHRMESDHAFTALPGVAGDVILEVQAVDDSPRYHMDIETDDVAAETERLIGLGATVVTRREGWNVLRAPGGHLVCAVPVQSDPEFFAAHATTWE
jgi:hypothetical protein